MATEYQLRNKAIVLLEDGTIFHGKILGKPKKPVCGKLHINNSMSGFQEVMSNPSLVDRLLVTTNPHIGNYGSCEHDAQSDAIQISGLICKNFSAKYSRSKADKSLKDEVLDQNKIIVSDIDTRALAVHIREYGPMKAVVGSENDDLDGLKNALAEYEVGVKLVEGGSNDHDRVTTSGDNSYKKVAVVDLGVKTGLLKWLEDNNCRVKTFSAESSFDTVEAWAPDGVLLSNGPNGPAQLKSTIHLVEKLIEHDYFVFGIGLGHLIMGSAFGVNVNTIEKVPFGASQPVLNEETGKGEITTQQLEFVLDKNQLQNHAELEITHHHLNSNDVMGIKSNDGKQFSVLYEPEGRPGTHDSKYLLENFIAGLS